eukprot:COSAG01_NODE_67961_length_265_cov_1.000000_1_plen_78_part_00
MRISAYCISVAALRAIAVSADGAAVSPPPPRLAAERLLAGEATVSFGAWAYLAWAYLEFLRLLQRLETPLRDSFLGE